MYVDNKKEQAFKIFKRIELKEPYPWPGDDLLIGCSSSASSSTDTPSKSENELDDLSNNRERGSVKLFLGAILCLYYGRKWIDSDPEKIATELINDFSNKGIPQPLERKAIIKWLTKAADRIKDN